MTRVQRQEVIMAYKMTSVAHFAELLDATTQLHDQFDEKETDFILETVGPVRDLRRIRETIDALKSSIEPLASASLDLTSATPRDLLSRLKILEHAERMLGLEHALVGRLADAFATEIQRLPYWK
jgi:hypothetical protein